MDRSLSPPLNVALFIALAACRSRSHDAPPPPAPRVTRPAHDASPPPRVDAPVTDAAATGPVNLLKHRDVGVQVSSAVENTTELPEHLIDGDPTTAWSSRTGDLNGAWIRISLPPTARVRELRVIVGYAKTGGDGDLFAMNQRVRRVRVVHDGTPVGTFDLDPERRDLQSIPLSGSGGVWMVVVTGLVPGTRPAWREVCVSELELLGDALPPSTHTNREIPAVGIRSAASGRVLTPEEARESVRGADRALRVALEGNNPEPGSTWYPHDNMMRYYEARAQVADAGAALVAALCPIDDALARRAWVYRAASRIERDYGSRYHNEYEPEAPSEGTSRPSTNAQGFAQRRRARDTAYETLRGSCAAASEAHALGDEVESIGIDGDTPVDQIQ